MQCLGIQLEIPALTLWPIIDIISRKKFRVVTVGMKHVFSPIPQMALIITRPSVSIVKVALTVDGAQIINKLSRRPEAQSNPAFLGNDDQPHNISRPIYFIFKIHWDAGMGSSWYHPLGSTNVILWQIMSHSIGTGGHKKNR